MRIITQEQAVKYEMDKYGKYALLDKSKDDIFLYAGSEEVCNQTLERMTPAHPKYNDMEVITF